MFPPMLGAISTTAAEAAITEGLTAGTTVAWAGLAITGLFLGVAIVKKALRGSK